MTAPIPASVPADGFIAIRWVLAIANPLAPNAATEINASSSVDSSCYISSSGFQNATDQAVIPDSRICQTDNLEQPGRKTNSLTITYVINPVSAGDNALYLALTELNTGFFVIRYGVPYSQAFAPGDVVDVWPSRCGVQQKMPPEDNTVIRVMQRMFITGPVRRDVELV